MDFGLITIIASLAFVGGVALTLRWMSRRPINVNVNAHAEAHGGSAHTSGAIVPNAAPAPARGMINAIKFLAIALIAAFCLMLGVNIMNKIGEPTKIIVSVPTQAAPNIVVQPPVVNIPQAAPPTINVQPTSGGMPPIEIVGLLLTGVASILTIIASAYILKRLREQRDTPAPYQYPIEYERTPYGWTPKRAAPPGSINAEEVVPGLFSPKEKR